MWNLPCSNKATCCSRTICPVVCAHSWPMIQKRRTNWKAITTQIEQILYWCRIPDNGWSRTVLHDKRHWRILTISRVTGLSWVHYSKRLKNIWSERLDSREHQNWTRIESHNLHATSKVNMEWEWELSVWTETILTGGSKFLMACISWSRNWATTRRTTASSRKPLRCSSKILRWKRMYLLLRADQRAKAKPWRRIPACSSTRNVPIGERTWTDIEVEN